MLSYIKSAANVFLTRDCFRASQATPSASGACVPAGELASPEVISGRRTRPAEGGSDAPSASGVAPYHSAIRNSFISGDAPPTLAHNPKLQTLSGRRTRPAEAWAKEEATHPPRQGLVPAIPHSAFVFCSVAAIGY
jgi:hypothetical protein